MAYELNESIMDLPALKVHDETVEVVYDFRVAPVDAVSPEFSASEQILAGLGSVESEIWAARDRADTLDQEIDRLTNHADGIDNLVAVGSGLLAGLIDVLWVGEFDFKRGKAWSNRTVNDFVMKVAKAQGYEGERLDGAIKHLEKNFKIPSDNIWKDQGAGITPKSHHLDDLAHHPTPIGLFFSILTQFTKKGYFQNGEGTFLPISVDEKGLELIGSDVPSKIFCGTVNWFFHLVSDMSGSNKTAGEGMGIPGPIMSLLKELATIPGLNKTGLPKKLKTAFEKGKFDLRSELAVAHEVGRQAIPVLVNEVLVRAFYFIRRLVTEVKAKRSFKGIEWEKTLPWKNRTIVRMLTIATGTFTAVDLADAAIRAALKSGDLATFGAQLLLRVNFVGVGRFVVAVYSDVSMGSQRERLRDERIAMLSEQLHWANAKVAYLQADVWQTSEHTETSLREAEQMMHQSIDIFARTWEENRISLRQIGQMRADIQAHNPRLINDIQDLLKWG
ncbi:hypothetical protein [Paraburkholderia bannensis]|uniref:hypothetical protein n=1 Tax=Paraburkholderia bannensis TaxID=765414 RepID=UPI002AB7845A|nr:hypothetical protein [Paraburkholderia bannensis]